MYKAVIFDLDGTLVYTLEDLKNSINSALKNLNYPFSYSLEETKRLIGSGTKNLCRRAISSLNPQDEEVEILFKEFTREYNEHQLDNASLYDGVMDVLIELRKKGIKLAILSNKVDKNTKEIISHLCKDFTFDFILGQTTIYPLKPDPTSLFKVIEELKVENDEVLYVGDSDTDMKTGNNAHVDVCAVTYGFREKEVLESYDPKYMIDSIKEILKIV